MTLADLLLMLSHLWFDVTVMPPRKGSITVDAIEYSQVDNYWIFRLDWEDMTIPGPTDDLPADVWEAIKTRASPGDDYTLLLVDSGIIKFDADEDYVEIERSLHGACAALTAEAERIAKLIAPYMQE